MKRLLFCIWLLGGLVEGALAQRDLFLFIQNSSGQPFYARLGGNSFPSSSAGHLTLAPMSDSLYSVFIGFPGTRYPEQLFPIAMEGRSRGFVLKNDNGHWLLDDLLSDSTIEVSGVNNETVLEGERKEDSYSLLMAGVVNDTAVLYSTVDSMRVVRDSIARSNAAARAKRRPNAADSAAAAKPSPTRQVNGMYLDKRDIIRYSTENIAEGKLMIYLDRSQPVIDTIRIVIPRL